MEAQSRRGELTVLGADGVGYTWHLKVFPHCPAVLCRFEMIGPATGSTTRGPGLMGVNGVTGRVGAEGAPDLLGLGGVAGVESVKAPSGGGDSGADMLERFRLRSFETQLSVVDFADQTDHEDNLATERVWRLSPKGRTAAVTNLFSVEDPVTGEGLAVLKLEALPDSRPVRSACDVLCQDQLVTVYGHGAGSEGSGCEWAVVGYSEGRWGRAIALHQVQACLREFRPGRDGVLLSNTWGDRNQDARVSEAFVAEEIKAGASMGVDVCQIDDGWQKGLTKNSVSAAANASWQGGFWDSDPHFWEPRPKGFPNGMDSTATAARAHLMGLGLWFSPDGSNDYSHWMQDADAVLGFYRRWGVRYVKIDGTHVASKQSEANLRRFIDRVLAETNGALTFDFDITADERPGYFGLIEAGPLFLENRYTDRHSWWPHATLRNLWQLSWYVSPQRLRVEFLNPTRNETLYAGDPLAPAAYPADYPFATTLVANPLAWFEVSSLPETVAAPIRALVSTWKARREELQGGVIVPIGDCPSGGSWTGFCSVGTASRQVIVFREKTASDTVQLGLPSTQGNWKVSPIAGTGHASFADGKLRVTIPGPLHYLWVRLSQPAG